MNKRLQSHFFWGPHAPLSALTGAGLIIMAYVRLVYAMLITGGILWVFCLTAMIYYSARKIMPQKGKSIILLFLSSFFCSIYILLTGLLNPLLINGIWFMLVLIPPCCVGSGFFDGMNKEDIPEILPGIWNEALCLGLVIIAFSLIREPLGMGSLSFPGGVWGIYEITGSKDGNGFFPIQILSVSSGGFILLGFIIAVFRRFRSIQFNNGEKS